MASSHSPVNIEKQILTIVASTVPNEAKKALIQYCCKHSLEILDNETCQDVLRLAIEWIVGEYEALVIESGQMLLKTWAQNKTPVVVSYFNESVLLTLVKLAEPSRILYILNCVFPYLKSSSKIHPQLCKIVSQEIITWIRPDDVQFCGRFALFLKENFECLPNETEKRLKLNILLIQCLGKTKIPKASKEEMIEFFNNVQNICEFLHMVWSNDLSQNFILMSVKECFEILSNPSFQSTVCLANITNYIPDDVINPIIYEVTSSGAVKERDIYSALSKMMKWLVWPKKTKVHLLLLTFFKCLVSAGKKSILQQLINEQILQVFSRVFMPVVREGNFVVLVNMLMNYLDSPKAFYKIMPFVPSLMVRLRNEKKEESDQYLTALGELMYTLMYRFPATSQETYAGLLVALEGTSKPTMAMMSKWLHSVNSVFISEKTKPGLTITPEMLDLIKNKTGLVNLGNTCYMNSILQCFYMLDMFRNTLFSRRTSPSRHPIMYSLQDVFTFLYMSKRDAIAPENFVRHSRPPWFPARTQQDCCEFVHYLMDKLENEDKSLLQDETVTTSAITNIVEQHFKGELCVTYKCMTCGNESARKEDFTNILLAFPDVNPFPTQKPESKGIAKEEQNSKSLKGGDQIRNFQESRYKEGSLETSKEIKVTNVQETGAASTNDSTTVLGQRSTFSIQEMLDYFMKSEELSGNNQYYCDQCLANVDGERRVQIAELPNVLMLTLKRFSFDVTSQTKPKLLHVVHYPEELEFWDIGENMKLVTKESCLGEDVVMKDEEKAMDTSSSLHSYKLCSVVVHAGLTCEAGHYYSYALNTTKTTDVPIKRQWYCFNDEKTYETSYKDFLEKEKVSVTDTTYIVIYAKDEVVIDHSSEQCEPPPEMIQRVEHDNIKFLQERSRSAVQQQQNVDKTDNNDKDDESPPPGNCGSNGSNFTVPENRFIF